MASSCCFGDIWASTVFKDYVNSMDAPWSGGCQETAHQSSTAQLFPAFIRRFPDGLLPADVDDAKSVQYNRWAVHRPGI